MVPSQPQPIKIAFETGVPQGPALRYGSPWLLVFALFWLLAVCLGFQDPLALAAQHAPLVAVGFLGAVLGNATAVGGGLVFIPVMVLLYGVSPLVALKLSLATQAFGMTSGALGWLARRAVPLRLAAAAALPTLAGCTVSAFFLRPSPLLIKGLFGPVSILIGVLMLFLLAHRRNSPGQAAPRPASATSPGLLCAAFFGGLLTGWVAIGVGEVVAAYLMLRHGERPERSIGLGVVLLAVASIYLATLHTTVLGGVPWDMAAFFVLGAVFGARLGPFLSQWISPVRLKLFFALIAIGDGILFLWQSLYS